MTWFDQRARVFTLGLGAVLMSGGPVGSATAADWSVQVKPTIVGTMLGYGPKTMDILLARKDGWEIWCHLHDGRRSIARFNYKTTDVDASLLDGRPFRFTDDGTVVEIKRRTATLKAGTTIRLDGVFTHAGKAVRYSDLIKPVALRRAMPLLRYDVDQVIVSWAMTFEATTILGKQWLRRTRYIPAWRAWMPVSWTYVSASGEKFTNSMTLRWVYIPGIAGKPRPIPDACRTPVG